MTTPTPIPTRKELIAKIIEQSPEDYRHQPDLYELHCEYYHTGERTEVSVKEAMDKCNDTYIDWFRSHAEIGEYFFEQNDWESEWPEVAVRYFDAEAFGRDLVLGGDVWQADGHTWRNL